MTKKSKRDVGKAEEINRKVKSAHNNTAFSAFDKKKKLTEGQFESLSGQARKLSDKVESNTWFGPIEASEGVGKKMRSDKAKRSGDFPFFKHTTKGK